MKIYAYLFQKTTGKKEFKTSLSFEIESIGEFNATIRRMILERKEAGLQFTAYQLISRQDGPCDSIPAQYYKRVELEAEILWAGRQDWVEAGAGKYKNVFFTSGLGCSHLSTPLDIEDAVKYYNLR